MTSDPQIVIQRAVARPCPICGLSRRKFFHKGEYIRAGGPDPTIPSMMWDVDGDADHNLILCLECGRVEDLTLLPTSYSDHTDFYADWNDDESS